MQIESQKDALPCREDNAHITGIEGKYLCSIISLLSLMKNGAAAEIGIVGNDGVIGTALFLGGGTNSNRAVVQSAGRAFKLNVQSLLAEFEKGTELQRRRYGHKNGALF